MNKSNRNNFTLLELLILIAVIVIFVGMVLPSCNAHVCVERPISCSGNLSQIGKAFFQYAMSWDDWFPTTMSGLPKNVGKWTGDAKSLDLLRSQDLLIDPKGYICPRFEMAEPAENNKPLTPKNISFAWNEGLMGTAATMSGICSDGYNTPHSNTRNKPWWKKKQVRGFFVRGDGSVASADGKDWVKEMRTKEDMNITFQ